MFILLTAENRPMFNSVYDLRQDSRGMNNATHTQNLLRLENSCPTRYHNQASENHARVIELNREPVLQAGSMLLARIALPDTARTVHSVAVSLIFTTTQ